MKQILFFFLILCAVTTHAQPPLRDTTFGSGPHAAYLRSVVRADVLEGRTIPETITPTGQKICFDKLMKVKSVTGRGSGVTCVYLDTRTGIIGYTPLKPGIDAACDIKQEDPNFVFSVIGLKGNVYNYRNNKKKNVIEHWVQTSNSATYQYEFISTGGNAPLRKKAERRDYCDGKIKAQLYKVDGKPTEWYLFGKQLPNEVLMQPKKFLGSMAVGYQYSDKGLFIIMQMVGTGIDSKILSLEEVNVCFDPSPFKIFEDEQEQKMRQNIQRQREKIAREEGKSEQYPSCQSKKASWLNYQKQALTRQEENMQQARTGNAMQDVRTQQAQTDLMSYDDAIQILIAETELKLCRAEQRMSQQPSEANQKKITCLQQSLAQQKQVQQRMQTINTQYRNEPGKQYGEKAKAMMGAMRPCN
ncbi:hypothetical protein ESA94_15145 [Lacibacter luteus]|uniref:GLPGLI family protein n=1 Tax=Lacibacter luteus TaxID=2508719 RepID=A0A4Q1CFF0_9BACT|nr:hypothetical protein [Lacibacter luteus]RXK58724.1 hypothetical protein ESA94_15145 [Lacibacter luteus]